MAGARCGFPLVGGLVMGALLATFFFTPHHSPPLCQQALVVQPIDSSEDWIVRQEKAPPVQPNDSQSKKVVRARFAATELGIRERLLVLVWAEGGALAAAINASLARHVPRVVALADSSRLDPERAELANLIPFRANGLHAHTHILNSIFNQTLQENYDWFLLIKESTYVNPFALHRFINKVSWKEKVAMGWPREGGRCNLDGGVLLSNPAMQLLIQQRHACNTILASSEQQAMEMCIQVATNASCTQEYQGRSYWFWGMSSGVAAHDAVSRLSSENGFNDSLSVSPLLSEADARALHDHFVKVEMERLDKEVASLEDEMRIHSAHLPEGPSWPPGVPPYSKAPNRYQVPVWEFFTSKDLFKSEPNENVHVLHAADKEDIDEVLKVARKIVEADENSAILDFVQLRNGYRLFDAQRGMDYILDVVYRDTETNELVDRRVHVSRNIEETKLMQQVPYVKEDSDLTIVVPVGSEEEVLPARRLLARHARLCGGGSEESRHTRIVTVLAASIDSRSQHFISNDLDELKRRCARSMLETAVLAVRESNVALHAAAALDEAVDHFGPHSIFLLLSPHADFGKELLDRARINTIKHYQVFMPLPFAEFHPTISGMEREGGGGETAASAREASLSRLRDGVPPIRRKPLLVHKDHGRFDSRDFSCLAVYGTDYMEVRARLALAPLSLDLASAFLQLPHIHLLRAVEPSLKIRYHRRDCSTSLASDDAMRCSLSARENLAAKDELARLLFNDQ